LNLAGFLLKSRGVPSLAKRIPGLFTRFGVTENKIASCLHRFADITEQFGTRPTFAITANLIPRHPKLIRELQDRGVEFAIHGLVHTNYAELPFREQRDHIEKAAQIFADYGVEFSGFRCPYLSSNRDTVLAVGEMGLKWESSDVISWDVLDLTRYAASQIDAYNKIARVYDAKDSRLETAMPRLENGLVEIPVSIPDDDILVDRLGIKDRSRIASIWLDILKNSHERGELFTIQLHHERIGFCGPALIRVLEEAQAMRPKVWFAQLGEISDWVFELQATELSVDKVGDNRFRVRVTGSDRATVLVKGTAVDMPGQAWANGYRLVEAKEFEITSETKPDVELWRWPHGAKSALSCTGDIDSITIIDFARRFVEV